MDMDVDMDTDDYGSSDGCTSYSSGEDEGEEVGGKRKRLWKEQAEAFATGVVKKSSDGYSGNIFCLVCQQVGRRGLVPDLKGLLQHCEKKNEEKSKHKKLWKMLKESQNLLEPRQVSGNEPGGKRQKFAALDGSMDAVTPFILILRNIRNKDPTRVLRQLQNEMIVTSKEQEPQVLVPNSGSHMPFAFAIFSNYRDLERVSDTLVRQGHGRGGWREFKSMEQWKYDNICHLFGYMATGDDMMDLDPDRKAVDWRVEDFKDVVQQPHQRAIEERQKLKEEGRELDAQARKAVEDQNRSKAIHREREKALENQKILNMQRQKWIEEETIVFEREQEKSKRRLANELSALKLEHATKIEELEKMKATNDKDTTNGSLVKCEEEIKATEKLMKEVDSTYDQLVKDVIKSKNSLRIKREDKFEMDKKWEVASKEKAKLAEKEMKINREIEDLQNRGTGEDKGDAISLDEKNILKQLAENGLSPEALEKATNKFCDKCKIKLKKTPNPSQEGHPQYKTALEQSQAMIGGCACASVCWKCAKLTRDKKLKCPCCGKRPPHKVFLFKLFGNLTLE